MSLLEKFREHASEALDMIREHPVLNVAAKAAISQIPVVGDLLVEVYESSRSSEDNKMVQLGRVLERFEHFQQQEFESLKARLPNIVVQTRKNGQALGQVLELSEGLIKQIGGLSEGIDRNHGEILRIQEEIRTQSSKRVELDSSYLGDRIFFFVHLRRLLRPTKALFFNQLKLADAILHNVPGAPSGDGLDDDVRRFHDQVPEDRRSAMRALRRHTDDMQKIHRTVHRLLGRNRAFAEDIPELDELYDHLSMWLAKYELLRTDDRMCLVFAGAAQGKAFPSEIEQKLDQKIAELRGEANL